VVVKSRVAALVLMTTISPVVVKSRVAARIKVVEKAINPAKMATSPQVVVKSRVAALVLMTTISPVVVDPVAA
jgi:hypothetical protein